MASLRSHIFRALVKRSRNWSRSIEELRRDVDAMGERMKAPRDVEVQSLAHFGIQGEWLVPPNPAPAHCMLYLHGGGYVMGSARSHRNLAARIAKACGVRVFLLEYRLAPEHPFPAALQDSLAAYRWLLQQGFKAKHIAVAGDSAGGGLVLSTTIALRDAGEPVPGRLVLISPWLDLTCSGESILSKAGIDPWITVEALQLRHAYAPSRSFGDPLVSPRFANLAGLPPMLVHVGTDEMLASDSQDLVEKVRAARGYVRPVTWPGMWHVFHAMAPYLPEANEAISDIGQFIRAWKAPWRVGVEGLPPLATVLASNP